MEKLPLIGAVLALLLAAACGHEPDNPYENSASLPIADLHASYAKLQDRVVDETLNSGFILGSEPAVDVELWLYDGAGAVTAKFPMRWRTTTTGIDFYAWWKKHGVIGMKGLNGVIAKDLLGSYAGFGSGLAILYGQTEYKGSNYHDVGMRMIFDRAGFGVDVGVKKVDVTKGAAPQTHSWESRIWVDQEAGW